MNKFTKQQWIEALTAETTIKLWGDEYTFKPVICAGRQGDGEKLIRITPICQRPYYWMIFADSEMDVSDDDIGDEDLEELLLMIEDEFGVHPYTQGIDCQDEEEFNELEDIPYYGYASYEDYLCCCEYPHIHWDGGFCTTIANFKTGDYSDDWLEIVEEFFNNK